MLLASGCTDSNNSANSRVVQVGDNVSVNYTGMLEDGTVFDTSIADVAKANGIYNPARNYEPLSFIVGSGQMIKGFDNAVIGMKVGENKTVHLSPEEAYEVKDYLIVPYPIETFEAANMTPVIGETISAQGYPGVIVNINETNVTVDFNNRLAGKNIIFDIELVSINNPENA
ncbi:peptidylprolyl isomerase [Methanolobus vulcani]|jgi:FKBP-type peptidyl-prolyl cis-trans isomerase 2|uniref:Peptidyl-prolyl cis-trans isomerase n=2 Tax=Methanolobus vulcani TaxID=38026 RepID=A0A7Z7FCE9_9EURY|nr:peptidylprolyl isomerase [Methanolobus sp.]SDF79764.1 peptidylprolyl isomerase [Methanolobus vulcani]